mmetsp:Transcript_29060/g.56860  ORF Transcript_29060/g.56860 Transcript_29060/m.56860 type:complete len:549 (+) Transcript_29060:116-1762(+)
MTTALVTECPACGNKFMPDSNFCRKCGMKRPGVDDTKLPGTVAQQTFDDLDADGDGIITRAEWGAAVGSVVPVPPVSQKPEASMKIGGGGVVMRLRGKSYDALGVSVNQVRTAAGGLAEAPWGGLALKPQISSGVACDGGKAALQEPDSVEEQSTQLRLGDNAEPTSHRLAKKDLIAPADSDDANEHYRKSSAPHVRNADSNPCVGEHDWEAIDKRLNSGERSGVCTNVLSRSRHVDVAPQAMSQQCAACAVPAGGVKRLATTTDKMECSAEAPGTMQARDESDYTEDLASQSNTNSFKSSRALLRVAGGVAASSFATEEESCVLPNGIKGCHPLQGQVAGAAAVEEASSAPSVPVPAFRSNRVAWGESVDTEETTRMQQAQSAKSRAAAGRGAGGGANSCFVGVGDRGGGGVSVDGASHGAQPKPHGGQMEAPGHRLESNAASQRQMYHYTEDQPSSVNSEELARKLDQGIGVADDRSDCHLEPDVEAYSRLTPIILDQFRERLDGMTRDQIHHENELLRKEIGVLRLEVDRFRAELQQPGIQIAVN